MLVIAISGSPRDGNTDAMLKRVLDGARELGATIELIKLRDKKIEFCDGCDRCYGTGRGCHISDDMQGLYSKCLDSNAVVLGSPNYFNNVSALMKNFMDRWQAYCKPPKLKGKKAAIIVVGGQSVADQQKTAEALEGFIKAMKMDLAGEILAVADAPKEVLKDTVVMRNCFELGQKLVGLCEKDA